MARVTDINRIERLKQSTMKLVVEKGYGGASASLIAKDAKVATGYFYLHYKTKYEMVNSIFQEVFREVYSIFDEQLKKSTTFLESTEPLIHYFIDMSNMEPIKIKFLYVLTNDYSFVINSKIKDDIYLLIRKLKEMGQNSKCLDAKITEEDLYLILFINPIQYVNQRFKNKKNGLKISLQEEKHLLYLINKFIK